MNIYESSCVLDSPDTLFPIRVHGPLAIGIVLSKKTKQTNFIFSFFEANISVRRQMSKLTEN